MSLLHKIARYIINFVCLSISITLTIYFFFGLSENLIFRFAVIPAVIVIECLCQYILSLGRFMLKNKKFIRAALLIIAYVWYLVVFALFSGMSYFNTEIAAKEKAASKIVFAESTERQKWEQNNILIESLNKQLLTESKTGYGSRSKEVMEQIGQLKAEQAELEAKFRQVTTSPQQEIVDVFGALADTFGLPANTLKIFVFGTVIMFIYLGLTLTNWEIDFNVSDEGENATNQNLDACPICGKTFPPKTNKIYCSPKCRLTAFRINKEADLQEVK